MADNVTITAGTGTTIATDEVTDATLGTAQVQYVKLMDGTLNGTSKATVNAVGLKVDASGAAVPITDNAGSITVDNAGTFAVQADTELPLAAALADATANPTVPSVGAEEMVFNGTTWDRRREPTADAMAVTGHASAALMGYNGTTWDRVRTANTGRLQVDVATAPTTTVSGTVTVTQATATNLKVDASGATVPVSDAAGSLTVDAPVGTPLFARLSDGTAALIGQKAMAASIPVVIASDQTLDPHNVGTVVSKTAQYTSAQTGVALWTPTSTKRLAITSVQIQVGGTTAGTMQLWFGASADTAYTRGTDYAIFDGEFAPSSTLKPGVVQTPVVPYLSPTADYILRVTTSAAMTVTVTVWGYEV